MMEKYIRDPKSSAILNTDTTAYKEYLRRREEHNKVSTLNTKVDKIESELTEIKDLLKLLITGKHNG